jgi:hypothetical protein
MCRGTIGSRMDERLVGGVGSYNSPVPIRCRGGLHFYSSREGASDRLHVVVMAPRLAREEARLRLAGLARVHRLAAGPHVPAVAAESLDAPTPWVALDCDAIADYENLTDFIHHGGDAPPWEWSSTVGKTLMQTLARVHRVREPDSGQAVCLGSLGAGNLLFGADGRMWLVGFGAGPLGGAVIAPEVAAGEAPTPGADVYALTVFLRSQIGFTKIHPVIRRVLSGRSLRQDAKLLVLLAWSNLRILAGAPQKRPTMEAALEQSHKMWRLLGFEPDGESFGRWVASALAAEPPRLADAPPRADAPLIVLGRDGEWLATPNGMRHALGRRRPLRRLLLALVHAHRSRAGASLSVDELLEAGWPGEQPLPEAGNNRVWVAISTLRKLGLGDTLQRWDGGYRLDPSVPCRIENAPSESAATRAG